MSDLIAEALHSDAEAARAEMRAAGIACPSCRVNMADLPQGHRLVMDAAQETAKCVDGTAASLGSFDAFRAAANVMLMDEYNARWDAATSQMLGG
jgi:hypothetical protein